ncbi:hypothetical protein ACLOJK_021118 [Asimina triloba]
MKLLLLAYARIPVQKLHQTNLCIGAHLSRLSAVDLNEKRRTGIGYRSFQFRQTDQGVTVGLALDISYKQVRLELTLMECRELIKAQGDSSTGSVAPLWRLSIVTKSHGMKARSLLSSSFRLESLKCRLMIERIKSGSACMPFISANDLIPQVDSHTFKGSSEPRELLGTV